MAERLNAPVLKTVSGETRSGVRIPLPPPQNKGLDCQPFILNGGQEIPSVQIWRKSEGARHQFGLNPVCLFIAARKRFSSI
jgi:hypothetical protein